MPVTIGSQFGPYEIVGLVGTGGMAEVYKARDTRLDRVVAVKVAKESFSERFEREARAVAALNHPNICTLYDVGTNYLVMEYIEGTPLRGPLPLPQALTYARQICTALDAAHKKNIIHRDLKPGNILVSRSGIKILDFGLAKISGGAVGMDDATLTNALTGKGEILGTLNYMSPEQLQGREAGVGSDIFSFGLVLYEMLTGKRAFDGSSPASVIAAILERPAPSSAHIAPPALDRLLRRCLEKDPENRWQSARDLGAELEWITDAPDSAVDPTARPQARRGRVAGWIVAAAFALALAISLWMLWPKRADMSSITFELNPPEGETFGGGYPVISPNGGMIAALTVDNGQRRISVRHLDSLSWQKLPGTEGAAGPSWSSDSRYLAFIAGTRLKKIDVTGGPPQPIAEVPGGWIPYSAWNRDGVILFSRQDGLWKVSASGGTPTQVTAYDKSQEETLHGAPQFLPDGRFLFLARSVQSGKGGLYAGSLNATGDKNRTFIMAATSSAVYAKGPSGAGYLLFEREGSLMAQPFDVETLKLTSEPFLAVAQVGLAGSAVAAAVSDAGMIATVADTGGGRIIQLAWVDRRGMPLRNVGPAGAYNDFSLAPDGKHLAVAQYYDRDLWLLDMTIGGLTRFTFDPSTDRVPVWSPDSNRVAYTRSAGSVYVKAANGTDEKQLPGALGSPNDWSSDGRSILGRGNDGDLWVVTDGKAARKVMQTPFNESQGQFSPDGKWIAFVSDENKRPEVYVQAFPQGDEKYPISTAGGMQPRWRHDGKELFYVTPEGKLMSVSVKTGATFEHASPTALFDIRVFDNPTIFFDYLVDGDTPRFLVRTEAKEAKVTPITVATNWLTLLKK